MLTHLRARAFLALSTLCAIATPVAALEEGSASTRNAAEGIELSVEEGRFEPEEARSFLYDLVAGDLEGDGDPDLFINWHKESRWELFENRAGRFHLLNGLNGLNRRDPAEDERIGLPEVFGVRSIRGDPAEVRAKLEALTPPFVAIWRWQLRWHVALRPRDGEEVSAQVTLLRKIEQISLDPSDYERLSGRQIRVTTAKPLHFRFEARAGRVEVTSSAPVLAGASLDRLSSPAMVNLGDPHGMAWLDVRGDARPELFIAQGGFSGILKPPLSPKHDRFFVPSEPGLRFEEDRGVFPPGYGRGRQVAWVDIDADGVAELYVGNAGSPNALYRRKGDVYEDVAAERGVDLHGSEVFRWLDLNGDGFDDLVAMDESGFRVALSRSGGGFEVRDGASMGLALPGADLGKPGQFPRRALRVLDVDSDGDLDLWLTGLGPDFLQAVYRFEAGRFEDATQELGLARSGVPDLVLFDGDNDGDVDAFTLPAGGLLVNQAGKGFVAGSPVASLPVLSRARGLAIDVEQDGLEDLVLLTPRRLVLRNRSAGGGRFLRVQLESGGRPAIGALVRLFLSDGRVRAQRLGSARTTWQSQSVLPLHFGVPAGVKVERLEVRWPGGTKQIVQVGGLDTVVRVIRPDPG